MQDFANFRTPLQLYFFWYRTLPNCRKQLFLVLCLFFIIYTVISLISFVCKFDCCYITIIVIEKRASLHNKIASINSSCFY